MTTRIMRVTKRSSEEQGSSRCFFSFVFCSVLCFLGCEVTFPLENQAAVIPVNENRIA